MGKRVLLTGTLLCTILLTLTLTLTLLAGCGTGSKTTTPLNAKNINLIFVVSPDLDHLDHGDINKDTANLTNQGLQRSLLLAAFLKTKVLGKKNVTGIYALAPMTHLQTAKKYPDMAAIEFIQQFTFLNQMALSSAPGSPSFAGNNYPINASYASGAVPKGVTGPPVFIPGCQGLDFNNTGGANEALVAGIVKKNVPGFYVFSAPWETISALMKNINKKQSYQLSLPSSYAGSNYVYAISIAPSGSASLVTFNSSMEPSSTIPALPSPLVKSSTVAEPFKITATGGVDGVVIPEGINKNETLYIVRHAEAHPTAYYADGNYVAAGQWRALDLPNALRGKIEPDQVYSIDPSQITEGTVSPSGNIYWSNVAPSLTVQPYAIANNLPYRVITSFLVTDPNAPRLSSDFFFKGGKFTDKKVLLGWQYALASQTVNALLASYNYKGPSASDWSATDYDSVWTVRIDDKGNLTVDNAKSEGIDSAKLPATAPQF
jgi:hypothetical protein